MSRTPLRKITCCDRRTSKSNRAFCSATIDQKKSVKHILKTMASAVVHYQVDVTNPPAMSVDDQIDNDQLEEYNEMIDELGTFPDKVLINSLTMIAEDYADQKESASKIYDCIRGKLLLAAGDHKLPIIYVIDSVLKNAKRCYIDLMEDDAKSWMPAVYRDIPDKVGREKLKKVWNTWNTFNVFSQEKWNEMGQCFNDNGEANDGSLSPNASSSVGMSSAAGIPRTKTGGLILKPALRKEMQKVLDELQNDIDNELEKVSLERLADINPDLLANIKQAAEDAMRSNHQNSSGGSGGNDRNEVETSFFTEIRPEEAVERSKAWVKLDLKHEADTQEVIAKLQDCVKDGSSAESRYTQSEAIEMTHALATASCAAELLSRALERRQSQDKKTSQMNPFSGKDGTTSSGVSTADKRLFTNDGIKKMNSAIIEMLYEVGLPFVSSSDGRRFKSQLELSKHLDRLFKKSQIDKSMARTEERGWYQSDRVWTGETTEEETENATGPGISEIPGTSAEDTNPDSFTEIADESRDRCVVCGINFKMFFDNEDGAYKYKNCREIEVMNDDVAANESDMMLVHVTCWRGLGSPDMLDIDQTLHQTSHI